MGKTNTDQSPAVAPVCASAKAIILDRDGTLITHVPYLFEPAKVSLLPGVREGLARAIAGGIAIFMHSNQSGVGRGLFPVEAVHACNRRLVELLGLGASPFSRICVAPEAPDQESRYRKPSPVFAQELMTEFGFSPQTMWYIGDRGSDLATAQAAGTRGVGVSTGLDDLRMELSEAGLSAYPVFPRFDQAIDFILGAPQP